MHFFATHSLCPCVLVVQTERKLLRVGGLGSVHVDPDQERDASHIEVPGDGFDRVHFAIEDDCVADLWVGRCLDRD